MTVSQTPRSIWVIDDDQSIRWVLQRALSDAGFEVVTFDNAASALTRFKRAEPEQRPKLILTDIRMPGISGFELLRQIHNIDATLPIIVMTAYSDLDTTVRGYQQGAFEYLPKPFDINKAVTLIIKACEQNEAAAAPVPATEADEIIGSSDTVQNIFRIIAKLAPLLSPVLISAEPGSGKSLVARAIHHHSTRRNNPFVTINLAAMPAESLERELFGHQSEGANKASVSYRGRLEQANEGTLFIEHIELLPAALQAKLAAALSAGYFYRDGSQRTITSNVRLICASQTDLAEEARTHTFNADLYHRIAVIELNIQPLRERSEDIPLLIRHYLSHFTSQLGEETKPVSDEAIAFLCGQHWPGNVRQLKNLCQNLAVVASGNVIQMRDLPGSLALETEETDQPDLLAQWQHLLSLWAKQEFAAGRSNLLNEASPTVEKILLEAALKATGGRKQEAARLMGWGRNTLTRKLKQLS